MSVYEYLSPEEITLALSENRDDEVSKRLLQIKLSKTKKKGEGRRRKKKLLFNLE
jgi:hypothetical protein